MEVRQSRGLCTLSASAVSVGIPGGNAYVLLIAIIFKVSGII